MLSQQYRRHAVDAANDGKFGAHAWMDHEMRVPAPRGEQVPAPMTAATFRGWQEDADNVARPVFARTTRSVDGWPIGAWFAGGVALIRDMVAMVDARAAETLPTLYASEPDTARAAIASMLRIGKSMVVPEAEVSVSDARFVAVLDMLGIPDDPSADMDAAEAPLSRFETTAGYRPAVDGTYRTARKLRRMTIVGRTLPAGTPQRPYVRQFRGGYLQAAAGAITRLYVATDDVSDAYALRHQADAILRGTGSAEDAALTHAAQFGTEDKMFNAVVTHSRDDASALLKLERQALAAVEEARQIGNASKRRKAVSAASRVLDDVRAALTAQTLSETGERQRRQHTSAASVGSPHKSNGETAKTLPNNGHQDKPRYPLLDRSGKSLVTVRKATDRETLRCLGLSLNLSDPSATNLNGTVSQYRTDYRGQHITGHGTWEQTMTARTLRQMMHAAIASGREQVTVEDLEQAASNRLHGHALAPGSSFTLYGIDGTRLAVQRSQSATYRVVIQRAGMAEHRVRAGRDEAMALAAVRRALAASPQVKQDKRRKSVA